MASGFKTFVNNSAWARLRARWQGVLAPKRGRWTFRSHLMALAAACVIPLLVLSFYTIGRYGTMEEEIGRNHQLATTRGLATIIDMKLRDAFADLNALVPFLTGDTIDLKEVY